MWTWSPAISISTMAHRFVLSPIYYFYSGPGPDPQSLTSSSFILCTKHMRLFQPWSSIFNNNIMDYFIKSKVLNLDSQPSQIWSLPFLNLRHFQLSTWKMLSRLIASKYSVTWNMYKFQRYALWTIIHGRCLTPSHVCQANFLKLRKPFCFHQAWFLLTAFPVHAHIWCQTLAPGDSHHYLEFSPSRYYLNIFFSADQQCCPMWKFQWTHIIPLSGLLLG